MSDKSDAVKRWRKNTKIRMVESMGGECQCCGYKRCNDALELHHIDPTEKEFGFGRIMANPKSWEKMVKELRKCILLCSNCHREIHDNVIDLPKEYKKFDENFSEYKTMDKVITYCPVCGNEKPSKNVTCSLNCAGSLNGKVKWNEIDLEKLLKEHNNYTKIGEILNVSGGAVSKRAKKLNIGIKK